VGFTFPDDLDHRGGNPQLNELPRDGTGAAFGQGPVMGLWAAGIGKAENPDFLRFRFLQTRRGVPQTLHRRGGDLGLVGVEVDDDRLHRPLDRRFNRWRRKRSRGGGRGNDRRGGHGHAPVTSVIGRGRTTGRHTGQAR